MTEKCAPLQSFHLLKEIKGWGGEEEKRRGKGATIFALSCFYNLGIKT
jgi:hypothetical protein